MASTDERTRREGGRPEDGPAVNALAGFLPSHDVVAVQRLRLLAEAVIEECFARHFEDLTPPKNDALSDWVAEHLDGTHVTILAAVLDTTITRAYGQARVATVACYGLPKLFAKALKGEITFVRLEYVAKRALGLTAKQLQDLDEALVTMREGVQWQGFCRKVNDTIRLLDPPTAREGESHQRRRVEVWAEDDCTGKLLLTGPLLPLKALHARLEATARAIRKHQTSTFGTQLWPGDEIVDERTMDQLMFDMLTTMTPTTRIRIQRGSGTGDGPAGAGDAWNGTAGEGGTTGTGDGRNAVTAGADRIGGADASAPADPDDAAAAGTELVEVSCPSGGEWLRRQAGVVVTVPALTLTRHADLPGLFADGSPIPAELAREFVAHTNVMWRVLTDPATGRVVDEVARTYVIPNALRTTLVQKRPWCTAPGCTRRAATCEQDHAIPYNHQNPSLGGRTDLHNLHPLCKRHHQLKTQGKLRLEHGPDGIIRWQLGCGIIHDDHPPDRPIDAAHADHFTGKPPDGGPPSQDTGPKPAADPPSDIGPPDRAGGDNGPPGSGGPAGAARPPGSVGPAGAAGPPGDAERPGSAAGPPGAGRHRADNGPPKPPRQATPSADPDPPERPPDAGTGKYEESPDVELPFEELGPHGMGDWRLWPNHGPPPPF
jgi:hypothetical protein